MSTPFISIVIPLYNKALYIEKTLKSVLNQTYNDYEILIVDDGSTDDGVELIKSNHKNDKIRIIQKENGGPSSARNRGVQEAKGEWVVFLDADDFFLPTALSVFSKLIENNKGINYFVCNYYIVQDGKIQLYSYTRRNGIIKKPFYLEAIRDLTERPGSSIIRKELLLEHPFKENFRRYEDAECQYEIMRNNIMYQHSEPVMITNRDTGCASAYRKNIEEDFVGSLVFKDKSFWEQMTLYLLALDCKRGYPQAANKLYGSIYKRLDLRMVYYVIAAYWVIRRVNNRFLNRGKNISLDDLLK